MNTLTPAEFELASSPLFSDSTDLLKLTIQHLCVESVIGIESRLVYLNKREKRPFKRFFLKRGERFDSYQTDKEAEKFVLALFHKLPEFRFYKLRNYVKHHFDSRGTTPFKYDYVLADMKERDLMFMRYFPTAKAKKELERIQSKLDQLESAVTGSASVELITALITDLGTHLILLEPKTIKKLGSLSKDVLAIKDLKFFQSLNQSFNTMDTFFYSDFGGFDSVDSGMFGGFDGGDFGGGGADGIW